MTKKNTRDVYLRGIKRQQKIMMLMNIEDGVKQRKHAKHAKNRTKM